MEFLKYLGKCYGFYHLNRNNLFHWDDPIIENVSEEGVALYTASIALCEKNLKLIAELRNRLLRAGDFLILKITGRFLSWGWLYFISKEVCDLSAQIIAITNQKGGVGKTTTCANLGIGLAMAGKKVLLIDADPQGSLTISLGYPQPDKLPVTLADMMEKVLRDEIFPEEEGIIHQAEGIDLMPADIRLSGMEISLVTAMSRETILKQYLETVKKRYTHILVDCQPSLGMLTVNVLAAADRILIPVQAEYLSAKGLEQLLSTVGKVRKQINPKLKIDGILLTMVDSRTNFAREISTLLRETYGEQIKVFRTDIPHSVRAKEISAEGKSIYLHDPKGKVAEAYRNLTREVINIEKQREKYKTGFCR